MHFPPNFSNVSQSGSALTHSRSALTNCSSVHVDSTAVQTPATVFSSGFWQDVQAPVSATHSLHLSLTLSQVKVALLKNVLPVQVSGVLVQAPLARVNPVEHLVHLVNSLKVSHPRGLVRHWPYLLY